MSATTREEALVQEAKFFTLRATIWALAALGMFALFVWHDRHTPRDVRVAKEIVHCADQLRKTLKPAAAASAPSDKAAESAAKPVDQRALEQLARDCQVLIGS